LAVAGLALVLSLEMAGTGPSPGSTVAASEQPKTPALEHPDTVCAQCHQAIYDRYEATAKARGSGLATDGLIPGGFHHDASGIDYKVYAREGSGWMSYRRAASDSAPELSGQRRLEYYIGSGHRGRTYLYRDEGRWYELPINFYTRQKAWAMAPAFDKASAMPAPLPVDPNCLHCHASEVQAAEPDARNHYATTPFRQGGIGCAACHGDASAHLARNGHGPILNPARLAPVARDSVCISCHLEGDAIVYKPGKSLARFVPGQALSDTAVYFVKASQPGGGARATSQYEALLRSACKRASGDRLTCTTCHDPHDDPPAAERVRYFRARCLACHTAPAMATHHAEQPDCATCHMPSRKTTDISHEQVTDHDIEAKPVPAANALLRSLSREGQPELVPVGGFAAGDRDFGLAYAQLAQRGDAAAGRLALHLLTSLPASTAPDLEVQVRLGFLKQREGDLAGARTAYAAALAADPWEPTALANLAVIDAGSGHLPEAVRLLERLVAADPAQTAAGLNLAFIECRLDRHEDALALLERLRQANPDDARLYRFATTGEYGGERCMLSAVNR
jgi:hypothetical protein